MHGLMPICHAAPKGGYSGRHWPTHRRASSLLGTFWDMDGVNFGSEGWLAAGRFELAGDQAEVIGELGAGLFAGIVVGHAEQAGGVDGGQEPGDPGGVLLDLA